MTTNNVLIVGAAKKVDYFNVLLYHCQPEHLAVYSPIETWNADLDSVLDQLQIKGHKLKENVDYLSIDPDRVILFTEDTGLEVVRLLEYCIEEKIELIIVNPQIKE